MEELRFVGLDVHKESIAIAVAEGRGGEPASLSTIPNDTRVLLKQLRKPRPREVLLRGRTDGIRAAA